MLRYVIMAYLLSIFVCNYRFIVGENWIGHVASQQCLGCSARSWDFQPVNLSLPHYWNGISTVYFISVSFIC